MSESLQTGGLSKEQYFLMCEQMRIEPNPEEIPIGYDDLDYESQLALRIFQLLPDKVEGMGGSWMGKDFSGLGTFLDIFEVDDRRQFIDLLSVLISETSEHYRRQQKQNAQKGKKGRR